MCFLYEKSSRSCFSRKRELSIWLLRNLHKWNSLTNRKIRTIYFYDCPGHSRNNCISKFCRLLRFAASLRQQCSSTIPCGILCFGVVFQPRTFSAQDLSTSELLRTLWMCGCFWANILVVFEIPHPFPLNTYFGTLAAGLGSFPFDCPTYLVQSDSRWASLRHSEFDIPW